MSGFKALIFAAILFTSINLLSILHYGYSPNLTDYLTPALYSSDVNLDDNNINILLCTDEKDKLLTYTLINSIIINSKPEDLDRLHFHILVLENVSLFMNDIEIYFKPYTNIIKFDIKSFKENKECYKLTKKMLKYTRKINVH